VKIIQNNVPIEFERIARITEVVLFQGKGEKSLRIIQLKNSVADYQAV
jgi:hypothetical protein